MTQWDRSMFDGDLQALLDVRPPVPISRINALRDLALAHREHLNYITQRILRFLETSPPDYRVAGLYLIDAIIRKPKDQQAECAVNDYRLRFQAVLRDHALQGLFSSCSEEDKARVIRVFTYWGEKHIYPKHFAEQLKIDAMYEPNVPSRQPTVIPNHKVADENLQQTLQTPFPTIPNNPTDLTHFLASLQTTATNQTGIQQDKFTCQALRSLSSSFNLQELSHYPPALHHFLQGLQLGAHLPAIAFNGALPSLFQPPPPPPSQQQQPAPYATTDLPGMQQTYTNTTFDDKAAVKYECIQEEEVVPSCQIALQQAQSHSPSPSLSVPTSSTTAAEHDMVPVKQEPFGENEPAVVESTQSTPQHPPSSPTSIPKVPASSPVPATTPPQLPAQPTPATSIEPIIASSMSLPVPSPEAMLSPRQPSPQPISTTPNPPLSETIPPPKTPPLPPVVEEEHVVPAISMDIAESQSINFEDKPTNDSVKRPLSPSFESKDEDTPIDSSQAIDNNAKRQRREEDELHESFNQPAQPTQTTRKTSRWDVKKDEVARPQTPPLPRPKTPPLPRPKTPPLPQEITATAPTTEVATSIGPDSTSMMEDVVEESTTLEQQQGLETHVQQQQDDRMPEISKSSNSTPSNAISSPHSAHVMMNNNIPRPKTSPSPPVPSLSTPNELTSIPAKNIPRPKTPPLPPQATEDALQNAMDDHSQSKSTKRHHSPSPSIDNNSRQMTDMNDPSEGSRQQPQLDNASPSNKRRKKTSNDDNVEDTRSKPKISNGESKSGKEQSKEDNKVKKSGKEKASSSAKGRSISSSPTTKSSMTKEGSSSSSTKHSKGKEASSSTKHSKEKEASSSTKHSREKEVSSSTKHSKEKEASPSARHSNYKDKTARSHESSSRPSTTSSKSASERSSTGKSTSERSQAHPPKSSEKSSSNTRSNESSRSSRDSNLKHSHKERSKDDTSERHRSERHSHYRIRDVSPPSRHAHKDEAPNTHYPPQLYSPSAPTAPSTLSPFARPGPVADSRLKKGFIRVLTRTMYVGPMPSDVEEEDIRDLFSQYGEILSISLNYRPDKKRNAFVQFGNRDSLTAAKEGSQKLRMGGKPVTVNWAHGFGPKALYSYEKGDTVIKLDELTKEEAALLRSAPVGGFQGSRMRDQVMVEEPGPLGGRQSTLHQKRRQPSASPQSEQHQQSYASPIIQSTPPSHHRQSPIHPPAASSLSQSQPPQYHEMHYPPESYHHHPQPFNGYYPATASPSSANPPPPVDPYQGVKYEQMHDYEVPQPVYPYPYYSGPHHYPPPPPQTSAPPPMHPSYYHQHPYPYPEQDPNVYYQHYYYQQQPSPQQPPHSNPYYYGYHDGYR